MEQIELLLQKFWSNQITLIELKQLHLLLSVHKDELSSQINLNFNVLEKEVANVLTKQKSHEILTAIHSKINGQKVPYDSYQQLKKLVYPILAAASVVGIIFFSVQLFNNERAYNKSSKVTPTGQNTIKSIINSQLVNERVVLQDGSLIVLQPGAAITYYQPFINNRRDISLTGNALFKVAKDKTKPFTVYAKGLSTTALGTKFWIYARAKETFKVNLLEGKVVIKKADNGVGFQKIFLTAGQQFNLNLVNKIYTVSNNLTITKKEVNNHQNTVENQVLNFVDEPLESVFVQIRNKYKQPLVFNKQDVKGLSFSGSFVATDNIQIILSAVCNMNDLQFKNIKGTITITKMP